MAFLWPNGSKTKPRVSDKYGAPRGGGRTHAGTDFVGYSTIRAITDGVVTKAGWHNAAAGYAVVIDAKVGGQTVTFCHFHVKAGSFKVRKGQKVKAGQALASMGKTGNATGLCDHVEIRFWKGGKFTTVNPETWIAARVASTAGDKPKPIPSEPKKNGTKTMMIHWNEPNAVIKPGKSGEYHATYGSRNHFLVFDGPILVDEFYADSLSGTQAKANAFAAQAGGPSVLVSKGEYDKVRARLIAAQSANATVEVGDVTVDLDYTKLATALASAMPKGFSGSLN